MSCKKSKLLEKLADLELNVAQLYLFFSKKFPEDENFWCQLHIEEKKHALVFETEMNLSSELTSLLENDLSLNEEGINRINQKISTLLDEYSKEPPSKIEAYLSAIQIEKAAGEFHYYKYASQQSNPNLNRIFYELSRDDRDHETRIKERINQWTGALCCLREGNSQELDIPGCP